jgi:catecholate siderophore receptor
MSGVKAPISLRALSALPSLVKIDGASPKALGVAVMLASGVGALAQTMLPAVKVDAPQQKEHPAAPPAKPKAVVSARQHAAHRAPSHATAAPRAGGASRSAVATSAQASGGAGDATRAVAAGANPYADAAAPYKVDRLSSNKFTEQLLNTPRTVTALTKETLRDKGATSLREIARSTAGVTLGTGEGGNAFGDRFFIRGFDARNDVFVDGIRDPAVSVRENFYTEQVEILRGPGSTFAGRGTAGGAVNIVTKQADDKDFVEFVAAGSPSDQTKRLTLDANKAISPILAVRVNALFQDANVAGRSYVTDDRHGVSASVLFKPLDNLKLTANYTHVDLRGLPDFGVAYNRVANRPVTEGLVSRNTYYGFVNRDFQKAQQDFGTYAAEYRVNEALLLNAKIRHERAVLNYVGTLAESPNISAGTVRLNPQSRYQVANVLAGQTDATLKFDLGPFKHSAVFGAEISHEYVTRDTYAGLASELSAGGNPSVTGSLYAPPNELPYSQQPYLNNNPTRINVDTKSVYLIETANYQDFVLLNGGVRFDDYHIGSFASTAVVGNHSSLVNYNFGAVVKPLPYASVYAAYATSANPVGAELDGSAPNYGGLNAAAQVFGPQYNRSVEVGTKWELFDRHLLATGALFQTDVSSAREVTGGVTTAVAAYRIQGVDLEVAGNITDKWSVIGGLVLMDSRIERSFAPTNVGLKLANVAHESFSLLSKYQITDAIELGGQAVYASKIYGGGNLVANGGASFNAAGWPSPTAANPFVNVPTVLPSHWRFDAFAEAKVGPNVTLKLSVMNIFNRTYYDAFYQSASPFVQVAPGRAATLEARVKF